MSDTERLEAAAAKLDEWAGNERTAAAQCRQHDTPGHQDNADRVERDAAIHDGTAALLRAVVADLIPCSHYVTTVQLAAVQQAAADYITEREQA